MYFYILSYTLLLTTAVVEGFTGGAGTNACSSMSPGHGGTAQTSESPYSIELSATEYQLGGSITGGYDASK